MAETIAEIIEALGLTREAIIDPAGRLATLAPCAIETDTRRLDAGSLFLALRGERFDGHDFLETAAARGAVAAIVDRPVACDLIQLVVPDTRLAFGLIARLRRTRWGGRLAAITGNSGKTTVRALCESILSRQAPTLATEGNLNNDIGVPMTLLRLEARHRLAVLELGANHTGEIAWTSALACPDVALINNVTDAHIGEFGSAGHIACAKGEILAGLGAQGIAVLNRHDRFFTLWQTLAEPREVIDFAIERAARVQALAPVSQDGCYRFTLCIDGCEAGRVALSLPGRHNVLNALAAAAVTFAMGSDPADICHGLTEAQGVARRMVPVPGIRRTLLIDDSYNANPGAMRAALDALSEFAGPRWCFLGAMGELGRYSGEAHRTLGAYAAALDLDMIASVGEGARAISAGAGARGRHFDDHASAIAFARECLPTNASVLIKGSLAAGMDRLVHALRSESFR